MATRAKSSDKSIDMMAYCERIITGEGGLHDFERYELATPNCDRDVASASWTIRCLANPDSKDSAAVLEAILTRRRELTGKNKTISTAKV